VGTWPLFIRLFFYSSFFLRFFFFLNEELQRYLLHLSTIYDLQRQELVEQNTVGEIEGQTKTANED
jgi:hypothetical protein